MTTDKPCATCRHLRPDEREPTQLRCGCPGAKWFFICVQFERKDGGRCGPEGRLWEVREKL